VDPEESAPRTARRVRPGETPIFCINLAASSDRRRRMQERFATAGVLDQVRFVEAIDRTSTLVDEELERSASNARSDRRRSEIGCALSHLKALREFVESSPSSVAGAVVFEDDVLLHREWGERLAGVLANLPEGAPVCALAHTAFGWMDLPWTGADPAARNLVPMQAGLWGAHGYWISRRHAKWILREYEGRPMADNFVAEFMVWRQGGFVARPPLAIEEGTASTIGRYDFELEARIAGVTRWGAENYSSAPGDAENYRDSLAERPQTICLCMIVKNEAKVIGRLADSVRGIIDHWVICDTGSTDGTPEKVEEVFAGIPGELFHDEWVDYGTNRTKMLERARGRADYLLILDADHTLRIEGRLPRLDAEAYALLVDESLAHWVPRLVRGDLEWRYVGAAHEYITCDQPHRTEVLPLLIVEHHADGGNQSDKLTRERDLLVSDLEKDPENPRTVFYLAQTYRVLGETDRAIEFYQRRIGLGGWHEELFYSMFQHASLVAERDWDAAVPLFLEAFEFEPGRAEPLHALAAGFRERHQYQVAAMFAVRGMHIAQPPRGLFVHRDVYEWGLEYEWSVCAFRLGEFAGALRASDHLLANHHLPEAFRDYVVGARQRCLVALDRAESSEDVDAVVLRSRTPPITTYLPGAQVGEIRLDVDPPWPQFNPTLTVDDAGYRAIVRTSNYTFSRDTYTTFDGDPMVRSIHYEVALDPALTPRSVRPIVDTFSPPDIPGLAHQGIEDCRVVRVGDQWLCVVTGRAFDASGLSKMGLVDLVEGEWRNLRLLETPWPGRHEKNWMPFVADGRLRFVYTCSPTVVLSCDTTTGALREETRCEASGHLFDERGGSQGVEVDGGVLFVTHSVSMPEGRRMYEHRFVLLDPGAGRFVAAGPRFRFLESRVEFCGGLARNGDLLVLGFGASDARAYLAVVSLRDALASLWPL